MAKGTQVGTESHVYDSTGNLEGLWTIDGKKVRAAFGDRKFWEGIDEIIRLYKELNPTEMAATQIENTNIKFTNQNATGSSDSGSTRHALNIPYGLYLVLIDYEPTLIRNKKTRISFMKRYPVFNACQTV